MRQFLLQFLSNKILWLGVFGWASAQALKFILTLFLQKKVDMSRFVGAGGMPSSHSACVMAVVVSTGIQEGFNSPIFALAFIFAFIVMYDAAGVRRAAGEQAKIINQIVNDFLDNDEDLLGKDLKELIGHTPFEVFAGAILGILIGLI